MDQAEKLKQDAESIRSHFDSSNARPIDKRGKILERVRGILALADREQIKNPEAADNYRAQADHLMVQYALEQWEVTKAQLKNAATFRPKPETRYIDFAWWSSNDRSSDLYSLFQDVAYHCRCVIAIRGYGGNGNYRQMPVIGLPSDLDYLDLLFTHLMVQMGRQLEPKPDPSLGFEQNAYTLRAAGMARPRIAKLLYDQGIIPNTGPGTDYWDAEANDGEGGRVEYRWLAPNKEKSLRARVRVAGEKWGAANGHDPTTTVNPKVWQRSFAAGFVREIDSRLADIRRLREQKANDDGQPGTTLALRDIRAMAVELYNELFPPPPPPKDDDDDKKKGRKAVVRSVRYSHRAMNAGRKAGSQADISGRPGEGLRKTPELPN